MRLTWTPSNLLVRCVWATEWATSEQQSLTKWQHYKITVKNQTSHWVVWERQIPESSSESASYLNTGLVHVPGDTKKGLTVNIEITRPVRLLLLRAHMRMTHTLENVKCEQSKGLTEAWRTNQQEIPRDTAEFRFRYRDANRTNYGTAGKVCIWSSAREWMSLSGFEVNTHDEEPRWSFTVRSLVAQVVSGAEAYHAL